MLVQSEEGCQNTQKQNIKLEIRESDVSPGQTEVKQGKFVEFISRAKGCFRETYKSQNINPISLTPKLTLGRGVSASKIFVTMLPCCCNHDSFIFSDFLCISGYFKLNLAYVNAINIHLENVNNGKFRPRDVRS